MFEDIAELIKQVSEDKSVPRNIREKCLESIRILNDQKDPVDIRINAVISYLDEISNDPNIPMYTRTQVWNIVSLLESKQK
ncbi:MAG: UPF0147 family protein [Nanoarchaeota archaeon]|nr:UPF0147 family protein [Nanoarchaeota archaeon]